MKILFLDDNAERHDRFRMAHIGMDITYVWNATDAIRELGTGQYKEASLDHDLNELLNMQLPPEGAGSGYDVAMFIAELPIEKRPAVVIVHSYNPEGASRMCKAMRSAQEDGMKLYRIPFDY